MANVTNKFKNDYSEQTPTSMAKGDQPQRVNRAGKGDQPQRVNREGKRDRGRIVYQGKIGPSKPAYADMPAPKPAPKPTPKPARKPTEINVPGGGLRTGKSSGGVMSASQARSMAPGNYSNAKVSMGGKTYTGVTVSSRTDSKGRTTKSVGNWTSTPDAGRSRNKNDTAGPRKDSSGRNASSMTGKRK